MVTCPSFSSESDAFGMVSSFPISSFFLSRRNSSMRLLMGPLFFKVLTSHGPFGMANKERRPLFPLFIKFVTETAFLRR